MRLPISMKAKPGQPTSGTNRVLTDLGSPSAPRRGTVLLAVMIVIAILSLLAYQYADMTTVEYKASVSAVRATQAKAAADSGIHYVVSILASADNITNICNDNLLSNEGAFKGIAAGADGATFTILAPVDPNDPGASGYIRYGLIDEGGKLNIAALLAMDPTGETLYKALLKLPNMEASQAGAIADFFDPDDDPRVDGAESDHYSGRGYRAKNGVPASIEELLLVEGVTPGLLFGGDLNRNGVIDPDEGDDLTDLGWSQYLTVHSRELNVNRKSTKLKDINGDMKNSTLYDDVTGSMNEDMAKFIALYRQYGPANSQGQQQTVRGAFVNLWNLATGKSMTGGSDKVVMYNLATGQSMTGDRVVAFSMKVTSPKSSESSSTPVPASLADLTREEALKKNGSKKIKSMVELIDAQVSVPDADPKKPPKLYTSPLKTPESQKELLPKMYELASTTKEDELAARININTAPKEVLLMLTGAVPEFTEADVDKILSLRPSPSSGQSGDAIFQTPAWLLTEAKVKKEAMTKLEKYITARSQVYRVQVIGRVGDQGPSARVEAVIDMNAGRPRIIYYRDLTEAGGTNVQQ